MKHYEKMQAAHLFETDDPELFVRIIFDKQRNK